MVIKSILKAINNGLGNGEECAFPVAIFKIKKVQTIMKKM